MSALETFRTSAGGHASEASPGVKNWPTFEVVPEAALEVFRAARAAGFEHLADLTAVDWLEGRPGDEAKAPVFQVVYNLYSYAHKERLCLVAYVPRAEPRLASAASVWPAADWHERECWDLYGVRFDGHPDLKRIMLPEEWDGHPLRKDYDQTKEQYIYREGPDDHVTTDPTKGW